MKGAVVDAVLREALPNGSSRSHPSLATSHSHLVRARLHVPEEWIVRRTFDSVHFHFTGRIRTRIVFTACRENLVSVSGRRSVDEFQPSQARDPRGQPRRSAILDLAIPNFTDLPPTRADAGSVYIPRKGGFGGQHVQGHADIEYHVEARIMLGSQMLGCVSEPVIVPKQRPACVIAPAVAVEAPAVPSMPRLMRRALSSPPPADLHVRVFDAPALRVDAEPPGGARSLSVPVTLLLREGRQREQRLARRALSCAIEARWFTTLRIATEPLSNKQRIIPVVEESTRWGRERSEVAFPPFCETAAAAADEGEESVTYATTADVRVRVPDCVDSPSIERGLFERAYTLKLSVCIDAGPEAPPQTAHGCVAIRVLGSAPAPSGGNSLAAMRGAEWAPPPAYASAMRDPIVTITV